jgi:adenosine deaminase
MSPEEHNAVQGYPDPATWPKVELHRHLPGAVRFESWLAIIQQQEPVLAEQSPARLKKLVTVDRQTTLKEFLSCFQYINLCFTSYENIQRITYEAIQDAAKEGIIYLELRFGPTRLGQSASISTEEAIRAIDAGRNAACQDFPISVGLIAGLSRELGVETCEQETKKILPLCGNILQGIDLLGDEKAFPARWFAEIFCDFQRIKNFGITAHAGEADEASSVWDAIQLLGATRIGHGIHAIDDPSVLALIKKQDITLEVCPTSNVHTGAVSTLREHPLPVLFRSGVRTVINTDDPAVSQINLLHELSLANHTLGLTLPEIYKMQYYAIEAAFCSPAIKKKIKAQLQSFQQQAGIPS